MSDALVVNAYSAGWLRKGFPWVYPKEVRRGLGPPGSVRRVVDESGAVLGTAICDDGWLAARVYRHDGGPLDAAWMTGVLDRARRLRDRVVPERTTGFRLVNGENDDLPGIRLDWWSHHAVIALDAPACARLVDLVCDWLDRELQPRGVALCYRREPRDARDWDRVTPRPGLVRGHAPTGPVRVLERGLAFDVDPMDGPDVGLYADMREVRAWLEPMWGGASVLNTFAYTGAFSVAAAYNGASEVVTVDLSGKVLERAMANFRANDLDPEQFEFEEADTFKALDRLRRTGRSFDRVILDPPAFSHSDAGVWSAARDYPRLVAGACRVLAPGGFLVAASNQGEVTPRSFDGFIADGVRKAGRRARLIHRGGQAADFPAAVEFPEGRYLKVGIYEVD